MKANSLSVKSSFFVFIALATLTLTVKAAPVQYQISGVISQYSPSYTLTPDQYPIPLGTTFSGTFYYDPSVALLGSGPIGYYAPGALSNFSMTFGSYNISPPLNKNDAWIYGTSDLNISFSSVNGYLTTTANGFGLNAIVFNLLGSLSTTQLPPELTQLYSAGIDFKFTKPKNPSTIYDFTGSVIVSQVPLPSAAWLFSSGIFSLFRVARNRK